MSNQSIRYRLSEVLHYLGKAVVNAQNLPYAVDDAHWKTLRWLDAHLQAANSQLKALLNEFERGRRLLGDE